MKHKKTFLLCGSWGLCASLLWFLVRPETFPLINPEDTPQIPRADAVTIDQIDSVQQLSHLLSRNQHQINFSIRLQYRSDNQLDWSTLNYNRKKQILIYTPAAYRPKRLYFAPYFPSITSLPGPVVNRGCSEKYICNKVTEAIIVKTGRSGGTIGTLLSYSGCDSGCLIVT